MVGRDAGPGVASELFSGTEREVPVDRLAEFPRRVDLTYRIGVAVENALDVHHFRESEQFWVLAEKTRGVGGGQNRA